MERLHVYAVSCAWTGPIEATGMLRGSHIPCCPYCGSVLFQIEEKKWQEGIPVHEAKGHTNYGDFIAWKEEQPKCWPTLEKAAAAFTEATGKPVILTLS